VKRSLARTTCPRKRLLLYAAIATVSCSVTVGCVRRSYNAAGHATALQKSVNPTASQPPRDALARINLNNAPAIELEKLPGIGKALAERIIEHREKFGPFRRPEHLIMVRGISDKRFRALQDLITVE
jgi:competence ComEA-like helix-hairpin-helix protein